MPVTRVEFTDAFCDRHLYFSGRDNAFPNQQAADIYAHASDIERWRHRRVPTTLGRSRVVTNIGADTSSTTIEVDELEIAMFRDLIMDAVNRSGMVLAAGNHIAFSIELPSQMNISATQDQGDQGTPTITYGTYVRLGANVLQNGNNITLIVNHLDGTYFGPTPATVPIVRG